MSIEPTVIQEPGSDVNIRLNVTLPEVVNDKPFKGH